MALNTFVEVEDTIVALVDLARTNPQRACAQLTSIGVSFRLKAWNDRPRARALARRIDDAIAEIEREHGLVNVSGHTTADLARGAHLPKKIRGY